MKILSIRLKNINALKGEWKIDFTQEPLMAAACLQLPGPQERVKPLYWMRSVWRCTAAHRA